MNIIGDGIMEQTLAITLQSSFPKTPTRSSRSVVTEIVHTIAHSEIYILFVYVSFAYYVSFVLETNKKAKEKLLRDIRWLFQLLRSPVRAEFHFPSHSSVLVRKLTRTCVILHFKLQSEVPLVLTSNAASLSITSHINDTILTIVFR